MRRVGSGFVLASMLLAGGGIAQQRQQQEIDLQAAIRKENVDGDLNGAIKQYGAIVAKYKTDRAVTAMALVRMAECHQKMGDAESRKIYEQVVQEYPDQKEAAAIARARLSVSAAARNAGVATRQIWAGTGVDGMGSPSPDGRFLSFTDWDTGDLAVRDLSEGTNRRLTHTGGWEASADYAESSVVSPDGRQVAYAWFDDKAGKYDLRVLPLDASEATKPHVVHRSDETDYIQPFSWTPDGKSLTAIRTLKDRTNQIVIVSIPDESIRVLKSLEWRYPRKASLSPDGRYIAYDAPSGDNVQAGDIFLLAADGSRETAVVQHPADDHSPVWSPDGSRILFVSDRTGSNALWSVRIGGGRPEGPAELVEADIGKFDPVGMTRGGTLYYLVGGVVRNIYTAELDASVHVKAAPALATDRFINSNSGPAWSPDGQYLAYYSERGPRVDGHGSNVLVVRSLKTGTERDVPTRLLLIGWVRWFPDGRSVLVASPDPQRRRVGHYRVEIETGNAELLHYVKVGPPVHPDLSPDGKTIFYAEHDPASNRSQLMRFDIQSGRETELKRAPESQYFGSLALSRDGGQLAYLLYDNSTRSSSLRVMPAEGGEPREIYSHRPWLDGSRFWGLAWTPDGRYMLFCRPDGSASNPKVTDLWRVPVAGGPPEKVGVAMNISRFPRVHPDGQRIAFESFDSGTFEVWALENFLPKLRASR